MQIVTGATVGALKDAHLPADSRRRCHFLKDNSVKHFLVGIGIYEPTNAEIAEFRLALLACINRNPSIARNIRFTALLWLTYNQHTFHLAGLQNLYEEILTSDLALMTQFDDKFSSLLMVATSHSRIEILQILKRHNVPLQAAAPENDTEHQPHPFFLTINGHVKDGETALHAYLRTKSAIGEDQPHYSAVIINAVEVLGVLLDKHYTREQMQELLRAVSRADNCFLFCSQIIDAALAERGILTFIAPRTIPQHNNVATAPSALLSFFDRSGDNGTLANIYDFLRPPTQKPSPKP